MKRFAAVAGGVALLAIHGARLPVAAAHEPSQGPRPLRALVAEALERNPELHAAREQWRAARMRIPQASALPDPLVGYMIMGEMLETRVGPQEDVFEAEQLVPFPGKLWQRRRIAAAEAQASKSQLQATERDIVRNVSDAYYDLYALDAMIQAVEEIESVLKRFEAIAQARYAAEGGSQRDVAKAQAEASDALQRLLMLRQQRQTTAALINTLVDRDPQAPLERVESPVLPTLALTLEQLLAMARKHRPELGEAQAQVNRGRHANSLAKLEYMPDLSVGFQYNVIGAGQTSDPDDGRDAWMVPLKITVPLWQHRLIPGVLEAKRSLRASEARLAQAQNITEYEVTGAYQRFTAAKQVAEIYEHALIPETDLALHSDQAGYEAGRVDVLNVIDSQRMALNTRIAYYQSLADALKSFAALERAVGTHLPALTEDSEAGGQPHGGHP